MKSRVLADVVFPTLLAIRVPGAQESFALVLMILTYHHRSQPVGLLKNLIPSLKPGATVVIVDPDPLTTYRQSPWVASPKSMILATGLASCRDTRTFEGLD